MSGAGAHPLGTMLICNCAPRFPLAASDISMGWRHDTLGSWKRRGGAGSHTTFGFWALDQTSTPQIALLHHSMLSLPDRGSARSVTISVLQDSGLRWARFAETWCRRRERLQGQMVACPPCNFQPGLWSVLGQTLPPSARGPNFEAPFFSPSSRQTHFC